MQQDNETKTASRGSGESGGGQTNSTDPILTDFLDPDSTAPKMPSNLPEPLPVVAIPVSSPEMAEIAAELGLTRWRPKRLQIMAEMGDILRQQGAIRVAAGEYVYSNMLREEIISECRDRLKSIKDPEVYSLVLSQLNALLSGKDAASKMMIEAMKLGLVKDPEADSGPKMPPRGARVTIVETNTSVEQKPAPG